MSRAAAPSMHRAGLAWPGAALAGVLVAGGLAGRLATDRLRSRALAPLAPSTPLGPEVRVVVAEPERLVLRGLGAGTPSDLLDATIVGAAGANGYGQIHGPPTRQGDAIARRYRHVTGEPPRPGEALTLDICAFAGATDAVGRPPETIDVATPVGPIAVGYLPGTRPEWAVLIHGRSVAPAEEPLRMLRAIADRGHPALLASYRNAVGAPAAPDGISRFGREEWADIDAAISFALARGARSIILGGISMGGAIALATAEHSGNRDLIAGAILDSPVLDLWSAVTAGARRGLGGGPLAQRVTLAVAKPAARIRFRLEWKQVDYVRRAAEMRVPVLLFHGSGDRIVPVAGSDALATIRPDLVSYRRTLGVGHARSWNVDPLGYERAVTGFLERVAPGPGGTSPRLVRQ